MTELIKWGLAAWVVTILLMIALVVPLHRGRPSYYASLGDPVAADAYDRKVLRAWSSVIVMMAVGLAWLVIIAVELA